MLRDPAFGWVDSAALRDGRVVFVRSARLGDEALIQSFVRGLSVQSRYQRFFLPLRELGMDHLKRLTQPHPRRHAALLALEPAGANAPAIAGMVEYASQAGSDTCEFAVVVGESWRRQGLALRLMQDLRDIAIVSGFAQVAIDVMRDNLPALELARRFGARRTEAKGVLGGGLGAGGIVRLLAPLVGPLAHRSASEDVGRPDPTGTRQPSWKSGSSTPRTYL